MPSFSIFITLPLYIGHTDNFYKKGEKVAYSLLVPYIKTVSDSKGEYISSETESVEHIQL